MDSELLEAGGFDLARLSDTELLRLRSMIDREGARRGLALTVGEIGERLVIETFRSRPDLPVLMPAPRGTKNVDALSRDGDRYSIKTLVRARKTGTVYPDDDPDRQLFEYLVIVVLSEELEPVQMIVLEWRQFCEVRSWDRRMQAWYVAKSRRVFDKGRRLFPVELVGDA